MPYKRLLWQIYSAYLLITVLALLIITVYLSYLLPEFYYDQISSDLKARALLVEEQILPFLEEMDFQRIDEISIKLGQSSSTRITVILPDGRVIGDSDGDAVNMENHGDRPEIIEALEKGLGKNVRLSDTLGINMMYLALPIEEQGRILAVIRTSIPVTAIDNELKRIYHRILIGVLIIAILAGGISLVISRRISRPVEQMRDVAQQFASGQLDLRVPVPGQTELAELAMSLNEMARQLQNRIETITGQRNESEAILSSMVEGVLAFDSAGHIVSINKAAANFLGVEKTDVRGRNVAEIVRNPDFQRFVQDILNEESPVEKDVVLLGQQELIVRFQGAGLTDNDGNRSGAVIIISDITRIRRLENLRRDFVANVSHELRTPITSIKGFVETLQEGAINEPAEAGRFLEIIAKHSDRLNAIVEDLLTLSRLEESNGDRQVTFEKVAIKPVLDSVIELSSIKAEEKQITIELDCDDKIEGTINTILLEQALLNLVDNAIKYSPEKGSVVISAKKIDKYIAISVQDNGCGISRKHQGRIFERFYVVDKSRSRRLGGTGLGLAIVKHIAEVHGGYVTVESIPEESTEFTIYLPWN